MSIKPAAKRQTRSPRKARPAASAQPTTVSTPPPSPPPPSPPHPSHAKRPRKPRAAVHASWSMGTIGAIALGAGVLPSTPTTPPRPAPVSVHQDPGKNPLPLLADGKTVDWWFAYKFSSQSFPGQQADPARSCSFGGALRRDGSNFSQRYVVASSANPVLADGPGLLGTSKADPLGATFGQIYNGNYYFVTWNDQFYGDPERDGKACDAKQCGKPWGHSKGILAWDQNGNGLLIQVTTPSWPGGGTSRAPRADGNTLGCISDDNNISNAQDFFALRLTRADLLVVLDALRIASVSTNVNDSQIVNRLVNGKRSPDDIDSRVAALGQISPDKTYLDTMLSSNVRILVKPSALHVPAWQFVSSRLGGENLRTATWWASPKIASTRSGADVHCWDPSLTVPAGRVDVATSGSWNGTRLGFTGGPNHAKLGVSISGGHGYAIFGDLNQQGNLGDPNAPNAAGCDSSQNGRGGMFFVLSNAALAGSMSKLIAGDTAPYPTP